MTSELSDLIPTDGEFGQGDTFEHWQRLLSSLARVEHKRSVCPRYLHQCAAPQLLPVPMSIPSGTSSVTAGSAACCHDPFDNRTGGGHISFRQFEHQFVMHLQQHAYMAQIRASVKAGIIRAIARLMMSALVPWIGALMAARSLPCRSFGFFELMRGNHVLRPNSVWE